MAADQTLKKDEGKPPLELLSPVALVGIARVLAFGAKKYAPNGWRRGISYSRILGAILRHTLAFMGGEDNDPETGLSHVHHLGCEVMFLAEFVETDRGAELDDRFKRPPPPASP